MPQGRRGGWARIVFAGVGALACAGFVGCLNNDKSKDSIRPANNTKQPGPGLPGTPMLPGMPGTGIGTPKTGQLPTNQFGTSGTGTVSGVGTGTTGFQQPGGFAAPAGNRTGVSPAVNTGFGSGAPGGSLAPSVQPSVGYQPAPSSGAGGTPAPNWGSGTTTGTGTVADPYRRPDPGVPPLTDLYPPAPPGGSGSVAPSVAPIAPIAPTGGPPSRGY